MPDPANYADSSKPDELQRLRIARAYAIERYAHVEHSLCQLFSHLLIAPLDRAALVFFKISNHRSRNTIIADLLNKHFKGEYDVYWNNTSGLQNKQHGLFKLIRQLDDTGNQPVHWTSVHQINVTPNGHGTSEDLQSPYSIYLGDGALRLSLTEIDDFSERAPFVNASLFMFTAVTLGSFHNFTDLRQIVWVKKGGSGSLVDEVMRPAADAASGDWRWSGV